MTGSRPDLRWAVETDVKSWGLINDEPDMAAYLDLQTDVNCLNIATWRIQEWFL